MSGMQNLTFVSNIQPVDGTLTVKAYVLWAKCKSATILAFPAAVQTKFYKELLMYGTQRSWLRTWIDRFKSSNSIGESEENVNNAWAALILHYLDKLWPKLDKMAPADWVQLEAIHTITNRIKGARLHGFGIGDKCTEPNRMEGFIDLVEDTSANQEFVDWVHKYFLTGKKEKQIQIHTK